MVALSIHEQRDCLLSACEAAADLLLRCDAEKMPNDLPAATDEDWDRVVEQLNNAIHTAKAGAQ